MRMTPLELDVQLQTSELIFRSLLEGKHVPIAPHENIRDWEKEVLSPEWVEENQEQRKEIHSQVKDSGENSPMWMESLAHMGDIAWEVFEAGDTGERTRSLKIMDRAEIIEQFKDLKHKVKISYYARCGAGNLMHGLRACIGLFRTCSCDSELLECMVSVLIDCVTDHEYNRDALSCLTVPAPHLERSVKLGFKDRGWSLLRNALDALVVQAGGAAYSVSKEEELQEHPINSCSKEVAVMIAEFLVCMKNAPAVLAQLKLVHEDPPEDCIIERLELREIIPRAKQTCEDLNKVAPSEALVKLIDMLVEGEAWVARARAADE